MSGKFESFYSRRVPESHHGVRFNLSIGYLAQNSRLIDAGTHLQQKYAVFSHQNFTKTAHLFRIFQTSLKK